MPKAAVLYARFSPRRDEKKCKSIDTQLALCYSYCKKKALKILASYEDRALSGSEADRPGLWNAVEALKREYVLVVYRWDRLARDVYLSEIIQREVKKKGAAIEAVEGGINGQTSEAVLVRQVLQAFAEYERKVIAARTKAAMLRHQAEGRLMGKIPPFGFAIDPEDSKRLVEIPKEQEVIKRIIRERQKDRGLREIGRELEKEGIPCRGHIHWHHSTIRKILRRAGIS